MTIQLGDMIHADHPALIGALPKTFPCPQCGGEGTGRLTKTTCQRCEGRKEVPVYGFRVKMRVWMNVQRVELIGIMLVR